MKDFTQLDKGELLSRIVFVFLIIGLIAVITLVFQKFVFESKALYAVSVGPILEEALKGGILVFFFLAIHIAWPEHGESLNTKKRWLVGGALTGLSIGLLENLFDYSFSLNRVLPALGHVAYTALVALGIWLYLQEEDKWNIDRITIPYMLAVISHILWNFHTCLGEKPVLYKTFGMLPFIVSITGIVIAWKTGFDFTQED